MPLIPLNYDNSDPEGYLFFNDIGDLDDAVLFDVYYNTEVEDAQRAFVIEFYNTGDTSAQAFAKVRFLSLHLARSIVSYSSTTYT